jgi:hypothetical protein
MMPIAPGTRRGARVAGVGILTGWGNGVASCRSGSR